MVVLLIVGADWKGEPATFDENRRPDGSTIVDFECLDVMAETGKFLASRLGSRCP